MTRHVWTSVLCDADGCTDGVSETSPNAREVAKRKGWVLARRKGATVDLCPAHKGGAR